MAEKSDLLKEIETYISDTQQAVKSKIVCKFFQVKIVKA